MSDRDNRLTAHKEANMPSITTPKQSNIHFNHVDRAPYELGHLLQELPRNLLSLSEVTPDERLIIEATAQHAENANGVAMRGLEAIGACLLAAASNDNFPLDRQQIQNLAALIQQLAVEAQFTQETIDSLEYVMSAQDARSLATKEPI